VAHKALCGVSHKRELLSFEKLNPNLLNSSLVKLKAKAKGYRVLTAGTLRD
jgi:hypothetical protein